MSQHADRYDDITLQIAHQAQRAADLYADDARRAWQTRVTEPSLMEAISAQLIMTSRTAQEGMQLRTAVQTPPILASK